jgi:hypothetical protein
MQILHSTLVPVADKTAAWFSSVADQHRPGTNCSTAKLGRIT